MNKEETSNFLVHVSNRHVLAELPTSYGKTKIALDRMANLLDSKDAKILIVVPRLVLIDTWKDEIAKWKYDKFLECIEFVTYMSFPKKSGMYDLIIFDEVHHLSARCREAIGNYIFTYSILLSATVGRDLKAILPALFPNLYVCRVSTKAAIQEEVLPDPKVYLIPLRLDDKRLSCEIIKNKSQRNELRIPFHDRFKYGKVKNRKIIISCTQQQYYNEISSMIEWCKKRTFSQVFKNMFLRKSGERLDWLSEQKTQFVKNILSDSLQDQRTLTFCNGIAQTEKLGKYCVNSKNKDSENNLEMFNEGKVNHITACDMLNEGVNLVNCRVGVYAALNSSNRLITQKLGRLLRHPNPVIIIPYYVNTRDEEIVSKMLENYNPELVTTVTNSNQLIL